MERTVREELSALKEAQESNAAMVEFLGRAVRVNAEIQKQAAAMRACMERVEAGGWPEGLLGQAGSVVAKLEKLAEELGRENREVVNWEGPDTL